VGIPVLIIGESGAGKSASMRNFKKGEIGVINVAGKPLPFRERLGDVKTDRYENVDAILRKAKAKSLVIDDCQYLMANEFMRRSGETGFQKFTDIGKNFWTLVKTITDELPEDVIVYFLGHLERDQNGNEKFKTVGKMLDEKITVEGMFSIVLKAVAQDGRYTFHTQTSGTDTAKSPMGMFDSLEIENDLKFVDKKIREYWQLDKENVNG